MNTEVIFSRLEVTSPWSVFVSLLCSLPLLSVQKHLLFSPPEWGNFRFRVICIRVHDAVIHV